MHGVLLYGFLFSANPRAYGVGWGRGGGEVGVFNIELDAVHLGDSLSTYLDAIRYRK